MRKTRNEIRRDRTLAWLAVICVVLVAVSALCLVSSFWESHQKNKPMERESKIVHSELSFPVTLAPPPTIISSPETSEQEEPDYDYSYVCRVVMAETGGEYNEDLTLAVCQAIMNAAIENNWNPEEVCINYKYTGPHDYVSDFIQELCDRVFLYGEVYENSGNAQVFYNPSYGHSSYHESQIFVCEIGGVRFFERVTV